MTTDPSVLWLAVIVLVLFIFTLLFLIQRDEKDKDERCELACSVVRDTTWEEEYEEWVVIITAGRWS